ncbi:GspE/PulE family protein [Verrucomicrobiota bacterium]
MNETNDSSADASRLVKASGKSEKAKVDNISEYRLPWPNDELAKRLLIKGLLTNEDLKKAVSVCGESNGILVETIVSLNLLDKAVVYEELAAIYGVPFVNLKSYACDPLVVSLIDEKTARELEVFPLFTIGESLTLAVANPGDIMMMDQAAAVSKHNIQLCLATREDIREAINRAYGSSGMVKDFLQEISESAVPGTQNITAQQNIAQTEESPVSQLVDLILAQAVRDRASDIHIDPDESSLKIRFRVDGILYEIPPPPKYLHPFIISRVKVMSNMDIAESRIPQDGHFQTDIDGRIIEARVSSMPTIHGENVAIRLMDTEVMAISLENLGVPESSLSEIDQMIRRPHGMIVITGPTGSGKSTTLYAMLDKARSPERHIITIEDPVEQRIKMISQVQVNVKAHVTFASTLRSILRQDPDVIMVGEIRDQETAQLAVRAALTGHLIFSTIHTNDAPGAITRLTNMNIEPFLLSSSLVGIIAQRLARRICQKCKETYELPKSLRKRLSSLTVELPDTIWKGKGCSHCRETGYSGRIALFELLTVSPKLAELISRNVPTERLRAQAQQDGMTSMMEEGLKKVKKGITTIDEVFRITELETVVESKPVIKQPEKEEISIEEKVEEVPETVSLDLNDYKLKVASWLSTNAERGTRKSEGEF